MLRYALFFLLLVGLLPASQIDLHSPGAAVTSYYDAMNAADLNALKQIMVEESFDLDVQVYALSIALKDPDFNTILKAYGKSREAEEIVKKEVVKKLQKRPKRAISDLAEIPLGQDRVMVRFKEDAKPKQLYLSSHGGLWQIDYKAGRKTD